ncbi:PREDICTED: beta-1,3-galactosyltransferase 1-like [Acropora digitifera]|uniref:beta-1,3-galactosyltransferase 1-like n=1 Tax=Acropora digitifera TaxID=70779 RepID=UPI00077B2076|nr:PREDICTED: beta-1,3-galactosyltransferase 1-like [Acropora digitifera]
MHWRKDRTVVIGVISFITGCVLTRLFCFVGNSVIERVGYCEREKDTPPYQTSSIDPEFNESPVTQQKPTTVREIATLPPYPPSFEGKAKFLSPPSSFQEKTFLFIVITTSARNFEARKAIRSSWGHRATNPSFQIVFVVGCDEVNDERVEEEAGIYGDILRGNFLDLYAQNELHTVKALLGLKWAISMGNSEYILKVNADSFVNVQGTIKWLRSLEENLERKDLYAGYCHRRVAVVRNSQSPYFIPDDQWSAVSLPDYSSGTGVVLSRGVGEKMVRLAPQMKMVHIDDVFLGIMAQNLNIECMDFSSRFDTAYTTMLTECDDLKFCVLGGVPAKDMFYLSQNVQNLGEICTQPSTEV